MFIDDLLKTKPIHIDEFGNRLWIDKDSMRYAESKELKNIMVCVVQTPNEKLTRVIYKNGLPIFEGKSIEDIGCHLDILSIIQD